MRKIYFIVSILCLVLTGCSTEKGDTSNIVIGKEISLFEQKCLDLMLNLSGYDFENHRIVTRLEEIKVDENENENEQQENNSNKEDNLVRISDIIYENNILSEPNEPNWVQAKDLAIEIQDIFIDLKIELKKKNIADENITTKSKYINSLVMNIKSENREESLKDLAKVYAELYDVLNLLLIKEEEIIVKKLYYDTAISFIGVAVNEETLYTEYIDKMVDDINKIDEKIKNENAVYLKNRIKTILFDMQNLDFNIEKDICRLQLSKIIEMAPILNSYSEKIDN